MRYLQLHSHVGFGLVGETAVFLDLKRDRYLSLTPPAEKAFAVLRAAEDPVLPWGRARDALLATGLFQERSIRGRLAAASAPRPRESLLDTALPRPGLLTSLHVWRAVARARQRRAGTALFDIVDALREARLARKPEGDPAYVEKTVREFLAARPLIPIERNCLLDSLAVLDLLGTAAGHAKLVFGVRLDPFGAHCWLQTDDRLLTDTHDLVGNFAPVFTV